ncbi:MAG: hypothetical protein F6J90_26790 [Moorea sp. SIOASIH]|uniref:hypothetical protein n=1 Tax=Moorena sp. SIOASIH TaxID=2607817 RepID=UPI0013BABA80|nr:hypothetical protein [Moorena sp. SIOASIH]NEO39740.1 hypothetical protein [Moorena sp. SIOASIH]NEO96683.1 hypothetical protein [Moorena sp. SIO3G5]
MSRVSVAQQIGLMLGISLVFGNCVASRSFAQTLFELDGRAYLVGADGAFLGLVSSNPVDEKSICNQLGDYGNLSGENSVWNREGNYGSSKSHLSAYNPSTELPPAIYYRKAQIGFLTVNPQIKNSFDPDLLFQAFCQ